MNHTRLKRMIAFTKIIKAGGRMHEFNFRKRLWPGEPVYEIDASDDQGKRHYITMHQEDGFWTINESTIADWFREVAINFPAVITEGETGARE